MLMRGLWALRTVERDHYNVDAQNILKHATLIASGFNPSEWTIKKINTDLYLFIPDEHLVSMGIAKAAVAAFNPEHISATELTLGLKVNHMQTTTVEELIRTPEEAPGSALEPTNTGSEATTYARYFIEALDDPATHTCTIFCTRTNYLNQEATGTPILMPAWSLYLDGHGISEKTIASLLLNDFKKLLNFLEHKICTRLLFYNTCYAGGLNLKAIYKDENKAVVVAQATGKEHASRTIERFDDKTVHALQQRYSFAIAMAAATDARTMNDSLRVEPFKISWLFGRPIKLDLTQQPQFNDFLQYATAEHLDYEKTITALEPTTPTKETNVWGQKFNIWGNIPQIKFPGAERFIYMAPHNDVITLGPILARTHTPEKPLDICSYFKANPKALLLDTPVILYELVFNAPPSTTGLRMKSIISILPGDALHTIKKISSSTQSAQQIMNWFMDSAIDYAHHKTFIIEEIQGKDKRLTHVSISYTENHDDMYRDVTSYASFTENNKYYTQEQDKKAELMITKQFDVVSTADIPQNLKECNKCIIGELLPLYRTSPTADPFKTNISDALNVLQWTLVKHPSIIHIKKVTGYYTDKKDALIKIPGVVDLAIITVTNIIVNESENRTYYTYNDKFYCGKDEISENYMEKFLRGEPLYSPPAQSSKDVHPLTAAMTPEVRDRARARHSGAGASVPRATAAPKPADGESEEPARAGAGYSSTAELNAVRAPLAGS